MTERKVFNEDGSPTTLNKLVREEPEWAANQIRQVDAALAELYEWVKNWDCPFQDDDEWLKEARPRIEAAIAERGGVTP